MYTADWCGSCKMLKPALTKAGIKFKIVDVTADAKSAAAENVKGLPTTIVKDNNGKEVERLVGYNPNIIEKLRKAMGGNE